MSNSSQTQLRYLAESTWGVTPASAMTNINFISDSLTRTTNTVVSNSIRSDGNVPDVIRTGVSTAGAINVELQYGAYDDFLQAALRGTWGTTVAISATTIAAVASGNIITDSGNGFVAGNIVQGMWIKIAGFVTSGNNGYAKVVSVAAGSITLSGLTMTNEAATPTVTIKGAMCKNGTTARSFTLEKEFVDVTQFLSYTGMRVGSASLNITPGSVITGSFNFQGKLDAEAGATVGTGAANAASTNSILNSVDNISLIREGGTLTSLDVTELSLEFGPTLRDQPVVGSLYGADIGAGTTSVTGSFSVYFESRALYTKYTAFTTTSFAFLVTDTAGNAYMFDVPSAKITGAPVQIGGKDQDVVVQYSFTGFLNSTDSKMIGITRFAA